MSFSKARIHRFNEDVSCAPPPGAYDPKYDDKGKAIPIVIHTAERFRDKKISPGSRSLCSSTESLEGLGSDIVPFRTPQLPRRKIPLTPALSSSKLDRILTRPSKGCSFLTCENKQKLELKQSEINELKEMSKALEEEVNRAKLDLVKKQEEEKCIIERHEKHMMELSDSHTELSTKLHQAENLLSSTREELTELRLSNKKLESSIEQKQQTILSVQAALSNMGLEISDLKKDHEKEKNRIVKDNLTEHTKLKHLLEELQEKMSTERSEYISCIEDMKIQISDLQEKKNNLEADMIEKEALTSELQEHIAELQNKPKKLKSQISELKETKRDLEAQMIEKEGIVSDLQEQIALLENRLEEVEAKKEAFEQQLKASKAEAKASEAHAAVLNERLSSLQARVNDMQVEKESLMIENANTMLELSLKHEERLQTMRESFENRFKAVQSNLIEDENNYQGLQAWLADRLDLLQDESASDLKNIETENQTKLDEISQSYSLIENKMKNLRCTLHSRISKYTAESESKYNQIFDRLAGKKKRAENERDSLKIELEVLETNLSGALKDCKTFQLVSKNAQAAVEALSFRLSESGTQIENLQKSETILLEEKEKLASLLKGKEMAYEKLEKSMNELEIELILQTKQIHDKLQEEVEKFKQIAKAQKEMYEENLVNSLQCRLELEERIQEIDEIVNVQSNEIQQLRTEVEDKNEENTKVKETLKQISSKITSLCSNWDGDESNNNSTCDNLDGCLENAKNNLIVIDNLNLILTQKENTIRESEANRQELLERFENLENRTNNLLFKNEEQLEQFHKLKEEMASGQDLINCLTAEKDSLNYRILGLKHEIESLTKSNSDKERKNESLEKDVSLKNETIEILNKDMYELSATLEKQELLLSESRKTLEEKENEIIDLEASIDTYYSRLKEKEDHYEQMMEKEKLIKELMKEKNQIMNDNSEKIRYLESMNSEYFEKLQEQEQISQSYKEQLNLLDEEKSTNRLLKDENERLIKQVEELQDAKESLKVVVSRSSCNLKMMSDKLTDFNKLENKIHELETKLKGETEKLQNVEKNHKLDSDKLKIQIEKLETELRGKTEKLQDVENDNNKLKIQIEKLESELNIKTEKLQDVEKSLETIRKRKDEYKVYAFELEQENKRMKCHERINEELKNKCADLERLVGPFRHHLEDYERENKILESENEAFGEERKALLLKFADLLGHQNPKQKIKHINKILEENEELLKEVEKLKKQIRKLRSAEKLNIENGLNSIKVDGNLSPRLPRADKTPLRERN